MGPQTQIFERRARVAAAVATLLVGLTVLLGIARPAGAQAGCTSVMGKATATPAQLAGWFATAKRSPKLDVTVLQLATMFVEEGAREGVRGDIAFAQSVVETGYFGFSPSVPPELHNYSGLGATGGGVKGAGFPDARTGVRAQVQHLRAYADPSVRSAADLRAPLVDPRFRFLVPNSKPVPCWEQFGGGVWAADPTGYGPRILSVHQRITAFKVPDAAAPEPAAPAPAGDVVSAVAEPTPVAPAPGATAAPAAPAPPTPAEIFAADMAAVQAVSLQATAFSAPPGEASAPDLLAQRAGATSSGGGAAAALACIFVGGALLTICVTLWWHGRRFARVV